MVAGGIIMTKDIVKYKNEMNKLKFKGLTKNDMNLFMSICSKMKDQEDNVVVLDFDYLRNISGYTGHTIDGFIADLRRMSKNIMAVNCEIITDNKIDMFNLFTRFVIDKNNQTLTVKVNPDFLWLLNEFTDVINGYTIFELKEFVGLQSKYAKNLYRLLKQWRTTGQYIFNDIAEFREKMDVPKTYSNMRLLQKVITPAVKEIVALDQSFKNFACQPIYAKKRGKPLIGYKFTWEAEKSGKSEKTIKSKTIETKTNTNKFCQFEQHQYSTEDIDMIERAMMKNQQRLL